MKAGKGSREEEEEGAASGKEGSGTGGGGGGGVEGLTAFVNLPFTTADAGLKDMFKACGGARGREGVSYCRRQYLLVCRLVAVSVGDAVW